MPTWLKALSITLVIGFTLLFLAGFLADDWLGNRLKSRVAEASAGEIALDFQTIKVDLLQQSVYLYQAQVRSVNSDSITVLAQRLAITDLGVFAFLFNNELNLDSLSISQLEANILAAPPKDSSSDFSLANYNIAPKLLTSLKAISIDNLKLSEAKLQLNHSSSDGLRVNINILQAQEIIIDSSQFITENRFLYATDWQLELDTLNVRTKALELGMDSVRINYQNGNLSTLAKYLVSSNPQLSAELRKVLVEKVEPYRYYTSNILNLQAVEVESLGLNLKPRALESSAADSSTSIPAFTLNRYLPKTIKSLRLKRVKLEEINASTGENRQFRASFQARNIHIGPNEAAFSSERFLHAQSLQLTLDSLSLTNLRLSTLAFTAENGQARLSIASIVSESPKVSMVAKDLSVSQLSISPPQESIRIGQIVVKNVRVRQKTSPTKASSKEAEPVRVEGLYSYLKPYAQQLQIDRIGVEDGTYTQTESGNSEPTLQVQGIKLALSNINVQPENAYQNNRLLHTGEIVGTVALLVNSPTDSRYRTELREVVINTSARTAAMTSFSLKAKETQFPYQQSPSDRYDFEVKKARLGGIDFHRALRDGDFTANLLEVDYASLVAKKDKSVKESGKPSPKPMPQEWFLNAKIPFSLDRVVIYQADIRYEEKHAKAPQAGVLSFNNLRIEGNHFANLPDYLQRHPIAELGGSGQIQHKGAFRTDMRIHMLSDSLKVEVRGAVDSMDMMELNEMAQYAGIGMIEKGQLIGSNWEFTANQKHSRGKMQFLYKNLKIQINTGDKADTSGLFQDAISGLINLVLVEGEVLPEEDESQPKLIGVRRKQEKGFFNYYWLTLFNGIKEFVGIPHSSVPKQ